jgi:hypothetical protein
MVADRRGPNGVMPRAAIVTAVYEFAVDLVIFNRRGFLFESNVPYGKSMRSWRWPEGDPFFAG